MEIRATGNWRWLLYAVAAGCQRSVTAQTGHPAWAWDAASAARIADIRYRCEKLERSNS